MLTLANLRSLSAVAALAATLLACGDAPVSPETRADGEVQKAPGILANHSTTYIGTARPLQRDVVLPADEIDSIYVTPEDWAILTLPQSDLTLYIPPGAVPSPIWVKAVSRKGPKIFYEFYPSPYHFLKPVYVAQDLRNTGAYRDKNTALQLQGAYLPQGSSDIGADGTAQVAEVFPTYLFNEKNKRQTRLAMYATDHFSGYILAVGFKRSAE
jgi:hypothetical protein